MKIIVSAFLIFLVGCAPRPYEVAFNCPFVELPPDPIPMTRKLTAQSKPNEVMKAWVITATDYRNWNIAVRKQINESR